MENSHPLSSDYCSQRGCAMTINTHLQLQTLYDDSSDLQPHTVYTPDVCITIAAKVDHDVGLSVHDAGESERSDVAPHFEGSEEGVVDDLLVQIGGVAQDPAESAHNNNHFTHCAPKKATKHREGKPLAAGLSYLREINGGRPKQNILIAPEPADGKMAQSTAFSHKRCAMYVYNKRVCWLLLCLAFESSVQTQSSRVGATCHKKPLV